jgi:hypothetical protein
MSEHTTLTAFAVFCAMVTDLNIQIFLASHGLPLGSDAGFASSSAPCPRLPLSPITGFAAARLPDAVDFLSGQAYADTFFRADDPGRQTVGDARILRAPARGFSRQGSD